VSEARIKGQEVELLLVKGGVPQASITDVRSFEIAAQLEILREGYLGETTDRRDEIYRGVRGRMEVHFEGAAIFNLMRGVIDRARRRSAAAIDEVINIKATLNFPGGDRPVILIRNAFFGEMPVTFGSRSDYGTLSLEFEAEDFTVLN
jgi:hypothetical protein